MRNLKEEVYEKVCGVLNTPQTTVNKLCTRHYMPIIGYGMDKVSGGPVGDGAASGAPRDGALRTSEKNGSDDALLSSGISVERPTHKTRHYSRLHFR
jgi:hypothetical protein